MNLKFSLILKARVMTESPSPSRELARSLLRENGGVRWTIFAQWSVQGHATRGLLRAGLSLGAGTRSCVVVYKISKLTCNGCDILCDNVIY